DGRGLQEGRGALGLDDRGEVRVVEAHGAGVERLDLHVVEDGPERVQARLQHGLDAAIDEDHGALVVLEVHDHGLVAERARADDHVEVLVDEPGVTDRDEVDRDLPERVPQAVAARTQYARELAVAEEQSALVRADLETTDNHQWAPPFGKGPRDGEPAATPRAWSDA